jgi:thiamine-monophosphate kinase
MCLMDAVVENRVLARWARLLPRAAAQRGEVHESDAELMPLGDGRLLALTLDTVAEELRLGLYRSAVTAGRVATIAALSDLAAVGADPIGILLGVSLPAATLDATQEQVAAGVRETCDAAGVSVLGGDTNEGPNLEITCVGVGTVPADGALSRVGALPGQWVFASGPLGTGGGLAATRLLGLDAARFEESDYRPPVRLREGRALRQLASACMDTSDGLIATLDQLARLNRLAIRVTRPLPELLDRRVDALRRAAELPAFPFLASHHGEFELVFIVPDRHLERLHELARAMAWTPLLLGRTEAGQGLFVGDAEIDGARVRNLLGETRGELVAYFRGLLAADPAAGGGTGYPARELAGLWADM